MKRTTLLALVLLAGCGGSSEGDEDGEASTAARSAKVAIEGFDYKPPTATVKVGGTVEFTNRDSANHTASGDDAAFDTGNLQQGKSASVTFDDAGTFAYVCEYHPGMAGEVVVE